jgi:6-pyruvoyltetrahydropterin/6-carboxytetrahydropterin synthase
MKITCEFHYDSAHFLPHVPPGHKCGRMHGHTYVLTVTVDGPVRDDGFVVDFADVKEVIDPLVKMLDHHLINDVPGLENPTVEVQLEWLWERINLPNLNELSLREGLSNAAIYTGPTT